MAVVKEVKMQDEPWYREIAAELRHYKKYKARIGVLEARMIRQTGPANKGLASYGGINAGAPTEEGTDETELSSGKMIIVAERPKGDRSRLDHNSPVRVVA